MYSERGKDNKKTRQKDKQISDVCGKERQKERKAGMRKIGKMTNREGKQRKGM